MLCRSAFFSVGSYAGQRFFSVGSYAGQRFFSAGSYAGQRFCWLAVMKVSVFQLGIMKELCRSAFLSVGSNAGVMKVSVYVHIGSYERVLQVSVLSKCTCRSVFFSWELGRSAVSYGGHQVKTNMRASTKLIFCMKVWFIYHIFSENLTGLLRVAPSNDTSFFSV